MAAKIPIYAATHKQVALALGLKPTRKQLAAVGEWIGRPDFPRKPAGKSGWLIAELKAWHRHGLKVEMGKQKAESRKQKADKKNPSSILHPPSSTPIELPAQEHPGSPLDLFLKPATDEDRRMRLVHQFNKWKEAKSSKADNRDLLEAGLITAEQARLADDAAPDGDEVSTAQDDSSAMGYAINQSALTEALARHFGQKYGFIISENKVSEWLRGKGIPQGCPPPPTKIKGRFNISEWAHWIESAFGAAGHDPQGQLIQEDYRRLDKAKLEQAEYDAGLARLKYEAEAGLTIKKSELGPALDAVRAAVLATLDKGEPQLQRLLLAKLKELAIPEIPLQQIMETVRTEQARHNDAMRQTWSTALLGLVKPAAASGNLPGE